MEMTRGFAGLRMFGLIAVLTAGLAIAPSAVTPAGAERALLPLECGTEQPVNEEPWAAPPMQERPGQPY